MKLRSGRHLLANNTNDVSIVKETDISNVADVIKPADTHKETTHKETAANKETATYTGPCQFFRLPPELRNEIYELAFTSFRDIPPKIVNGLPASWLTTKPCIDLSTTSSPSMSALVTCKQTHHEAKLLYADIRQNFWSDHTFFINLELDSHVSDRNFRISHVEEKISCKSIGKDALKHITRLIVLNSERWTQCAAALYVLVDGSWHKECSEHGKISATLYQQGWPGLWLCDHSYTDGFKDDRLEQLDLVYHIAAIANPFAFTTVN